MNNSDVVLMDVETQSAIDLRKVGAQAYLRDSTTRLLSCVFLLDGTLIIWVPPSRMPTKMDRATTLMTSLRTVAPDRRLLIHIEDRIPQMVQSAITIGRPFVAHNADGFDRIAWERFAPGEQPEWIDTIHGCRASGLPAGLDAASRALGGEGKSKDGSRAMKMLTTAKALRGSVSYPVGTVELWIELLRYNIIDVLELERIYLAVGDPEPDLLRVHRRINARGIPVDIPLARTLCDLWTKLGDTARDEVAELTGGALRGIDLDSAAKVKHWLARKGFPVQSLARAQLESMIDDPASFFGDTDDPRAALIEYVLRCRQNAVRTAPGKLDRILGSSVDSRVKGCFVYHGAHTGRFSARDLQPHNFPRGLADLDVGSLLAKHAAGSLSIDDVDLAARCAAGSTGDAIASLMRPVIRAPVGRRLAICDYASVEARCVAWLARDDAMLAAFAGADSGQIYLDTATAVFGRPITRADKAERQLGKIIALGCGYQMGAAKFGISAKLGGADLTAAGVTAEQCVAAFRSAYPSVPVAWRTLNRAMIDTIERGGERVACRCVFRRDGDDVVIVLPSGRNLRYRNARMEPIIPVWGGAPIPSPCYTSNHGYRKSLYGGILMENISQATCRDLLADAMIELDRREYETVMHVHDECVDECDEGDAEQHLRTMLVVMSTPPVWADGFPLAVEGYTSTHYVKSPLTGYYHGTASMGSVTSFEVVKAKANTPTVATPRVSAADITPDSPIVWPYWSANEPQTQEHEDALLATITDVSSVYIAAGMYGIKPEELRRIADDQLRVEDAFAASRRALWHHLRKTIGLSPTNRVFESDHANPLLRWDEVVSHLLTTRESYAETFPFRNIDDANSTKVEGDAAAWLWDFYRAGEPKAPSRKDRLEGVLRTLLEHRREALAVPF
jgi:DNA polymerase